MHRIGSWQFEVEAATIRQGNTEKVLEDRSARVLEMLCRRRGEVVSKDEMLAEVWHGRTVSPNSVAIVIGDLRRALGDDPTQPAHVVTVGKRGYRLMPAPDVAPPRSRSRQRWIYALTFVTVLVLISSAVRTILANRATPVDLVVAPTRNETGRTGYDALARSLTTVVIDRSTRFRGVRLFSPDIPQSNGHRVLLASRLIIWNGAPELALTATDSSSGAILWSAFASGASGNLARDAGIKLGALQVELQRPVQ